MQRSHLRGIHSSILRIQLLRLLHMVQPLCQWSSCQSFFLGGVLFICGVLRMKILHCLISWLIMVGGNLGFLRLRHRRNLPRIKSRYFRLYLYLLFGCPSYQHLFVTSHFLGRYLAPRSCLVACLTSSFLSQILSIQPTRQISMSYWVCHWFQQTIVLCRLPLYR